MQYTAIVHGEQVEITVDRTAGCIKATIGGRSYNLHTAEVEPGVYWFTSDAGSFEIAVVQHADGYMTSVGDHRIPVEIVDARRALRRAAQGGHDGIVEIRAPMPGKIVRILAEQDSPIEANHGIVVMEAMKMQNEIKSPKSGRVRKMNVAQGAAVNAGDLIAVVE